MLIMWVTLFPGVESILLTSPIENGLNKLLSKWSTSSLCCVAAANLSSSTSTSIFEASASDTSPGAFFYPLFFFLFFEPLENYL